MGVTVDEEGFVFTFEEVQHNHDIHVSTGFSGAIMHREVHLLLQETMLNSCSVEESWEVVHEWVYNERTNLQYAQGQWN